MDTIFALRKATFYALLPLIIVSFYSCSTTSQSAINLTPNSSLKTNAEYQGENNMGWAITHNIMYPESETEVNRAGVVDISFIVNETGKVENVKVSVKEEEGVADLAVARKIITEKEVLDLNPAVLQSVINSVEMLKFRPAYQNGRPISSEISTSVEFILIP
ncbi:MAG: hypothetical protein BalsKO_04770 [Balneolaceae bacterium]